jgi:hypothetical protein
MSLIMVMFFTVSSVCAVDGEIQFISAQNSTDELESTVNDDDLKIDDADENLAVTNDFDDLYDVINEDTSKTYIELERDYHGSYDGAEVSQ